MRKLIVHIGNHKTGSTTIQNTLSMNRKDLTKWGVLYPDAGINKQAHHNFAFSLTNSMTGFEGKIDTFETYVQQLMDEISVKQPHTVVISSEEFITFRPDQIEKFKFLLNFFDEVEIVAYYRNQVEHFESAYKFLVLWEGTEIKESFHDFVDKNVKSTYHEYDLQIKKWEHVHKNSRVIVKNFHDEIKTGIAKGFFDLLNLKLGSLVIEDKTVNASLSRLGTLLLLAHNREGSSSAEERVRLVKFLSTLPSVKKASLYTPEQYQNASDRFQSSNERLKQLCGVDLNATIKSVENIQCLGELLTEKDLVDLLQIVSK